MMCSDEVLSRQYCTDIIMYGKTASQSLMATDSMPYCDVCKLSFKTHQVSTPVLPFSLL